MLPGPEKLLAKNLINRYQEVGIEGRPVEKVTDTIDVTIGLKLLKLFEADDNGISISVYLEMEWNDPFLKWTPGEYGGVDSIALPAKKIWKPDIVAYNDFYHNADQLASTMERYDVLVKSDGTVLWVPTVTYRLLQAKQTNKEKHFSLSFGSWVYDTGKIDMKFRDGVENMDLAFFEKSDTLSVVEKKATRSLFPYEGLTYTMITYDICVETV